MDFKSYGLQKGHFGVLFVLVDKFLGIPLNLLVPTLVHLNTVFQDHLYNMYIHITWPQIP